MAGEKDLCRLACKQSERRHVAKGIAGQKRTERALPCELRPRRHAQPPAFSAHGRPQSPEQQDDTEAPAYSLDAFGNGGNADTADGVRKQRRPRYNRKKREKATRGRYVLHAEGRDEKQNQ